MGGIRMKLRRIIAFFMACVLICGSLHTISVKAASSAGGDVNGDAEIDVRDLIRLKKYCASTKVDINISQADWNGDSKINSEDVNRLRKWLVSESDEYAFRGFPSMFSTENGNLTVTSTEDFPEIKFENSNQENAYITIDDSCFKEQLTEYDAICFKVRYSTSGYLKATGVSVSVVTQDNEVIKNATSLTKDQEIEVCLSKEEMTTYQDENNGLRIKLTATKTAYIGSYAYTLTLSDFCVADEMNRFSCTNSEGTAYGTMSSAVELSKEQYPFVTATYKNNRWQRWSFITIADEDYRNSITQYDSIEFDVMLKKPTIGEFDYVELDIQNGEIKLREHINLKYNEWLHVSLSPSEVHQYMTLDEDLCLVLSVNGGDENQKGLTHMDYDLCIDNFQVVKNGNKDCFKNAESMFAHTYQETETDIWFDAESRYGTISKVTGPIYEKEGNEFTKFVNSYDSRWSFININDALFKNGLTTEDSIRFYVYIEKNADFDAAYVNLGLVSNVNNNRIKNDINVPFNQWTMVTLMGSEVQTYLNGNDGMRICTTVGPDDAGTNFSFNIYLSGVEVMKLANMNLTTDMFTTTDSECSFEQYGAVPNGFYTGTSVIYVNQIWQQNPIIDIEDSKIKEVIEVGDSLEFWVYLEHNLGDITATGPLYLTSKTSAVAFGASTTVKQHGGDWMKITLDAEGVQKYLEANDGLRIRMNLTGADFYQFKCYIGQLTVVKNIELQTTTTIHKDVLEADTTRVHGVYDSVSAKYTNGYWDMWSYISVDDSSFKNTITKYDSIEFWAYVTGGQSTVETISLSVFSEQNSTLIKDKVTLTKDNWTQIKLTPTEVAAYMQGAEGMKFLITADGTNVESQGGTDYTLYIDEFQVIQNGYYDEVKALEPYSCTNTGLIGTFDVDYDMVRGTNNRCSAVFSNHQDSRWTFLTIDDSTFKGEITSNTVIEFWAYLKPSTASGCDYTNITLMVGTNSSPNGILGEQTLAFNDWTKISLSGDAIEKYMEPQDGLRLCISVYDGSNMSYTLYLEDLRVVQPSDAVKGSLSLVDVYAASSSDKILQTEDCSYLEKEFVLNTFRNEYESGQLILSSRGDVSGFMVNATDFSSENATLNADCFEIYSEYYHEIETIYGRESQQEPGMYPDALLPIDTAAEFGLNQIEKGKNQGIWIVVKIPAKQPAGTYHGNFVITLGNQTKRIPAQITVADYTLPDTVSLQSCIPIQWAFLSEAERTDSVEYYTKYVDLLNKFRLSAQYVMLSSTDSDGYMRGRQEAEAVLPYADKAACSSYAIRVVETEHETYGKVLNQSLFELYLKAFIDVSLENQKDLLKKAYVYMGNICDEPTPGIADERAQFCAGQFNSAVSNAVEYLETKTGDEALLSQIKNSLQSLQNVVTADKRDSLSDVNTYCPMVDAFDSTANLTEKTITDNYWWYTCTQPKIPYPTYHIDDEAASARIMGWLAKQSGVKGYLTWEMIYALNADGDAYLKGAALYDNVHRFIDAYGDGFLVYPGRIFGLENPVESLRLYALGDGLEDYEALNDLENTYEELAAQYNTSISAKGIMKYLYDMLADNTRVYGEDSEIASAREILTQLLLLAKNEGTAISDFLIENGVATYRLVNASGVEQGSYDLEATTTQFATSNVTTTDNITVSSGTTEGTSVKVTMSGLTEYDVNCSLPSGAVTSNVNKMYLTIYNDSPVTVTLTVYSNKTEKLDTFTLQPGKNVLSFAHMQRLKWFTRNGMQSVTFKVTTSDVTETTLQFGKITVMNK